ncbi:YIP1 family protein [Candidatus Woesearchaeota archaeon]|nr:YIP1 family protein [Candidatus Woesearchaeota archaeon]
MMNFLINKIKSLLLDPHKFFSNLKKESGIENALKYYALLSLIPAFFSFTFGRMWSSYYADALENFLGITVPLAKLSFGALFMTAILIYLFLLGLSFVWAGILHLWIMIFDGKETYEKTYQLSVYAQTPKLLLGWVPVLGALVWIYDLFLLVVGTEKVHGIPQKKALMMYLFPALFFFFLALAGLMISFFFLTAISGELTQGLAANLI